MKNTGIEIDSKLINTILEYPFRDTTLKKRYKDPTFISNSDWKFFISIMQERIINHILNLQNIDVFSLIQPKLHNYISIDALLEAKDDDLKKTIKLLDAKTLRNCFRKDVNTDEITCTASRMTINIFKAFQIVVEYEKTRQEKLHRIAGSYNLYNRHNLSDIQFQISHIHIDKNDRNHRINYISRKPKNEDQPISVQLIGNDKVWITHQREDCVLTFYGFIGRGIEPKVIQLPFLYNNELGHTIGGLAIMEKVNSEEELIPICREQSEIPLRKKYLKQNAEKEDLTELLEESQEDLTQRKIIQTFLYSQGGVIIPKLINGYPSKKNTSRLKFDINDLKIHPGAYPTTSTLFYNGTESYVGNYNIYFNERFPSLEGYESNEFGSTVGKGILRIYKDKTTGVLKCSMKSRKNREGKILMHEGYVMNDKLESSSYIIINLYSSDNSDRYLNLILRKVSDSLLMGVHNIMYQPPGKLGAGAIVLIKIKDEKFCFSESVPSSLGFKEMKRIENLTKSPTKEYLAFNYLSDNRNGNIYPSSDLEYLKRFDQLLHAGVYRIYSKARKGLRVNYIKIYDNGFVECVAISGGEYIYSIGQATLLRSILTINLSNKSNQRRASFSVKVGEIKPSLQTSQLPGKVNPTVYSGTFCGVTRHGGEHPVAGKVLFEFFGKNGTLEGFEQQSTENGVAEASASVTLKPEIIFLNTSEARKDLIEIVKAITIKKTDSNIGFYGEKSNIYRKSDLKEYNKSSIQEEIKNNSLSTSQ